MSGWDYGEKMPCKICGHYPEGEYVDYRLPLWGICAMCFEEGIGEYFDEYLVDTDWEKEFYIGNLKEDGYAFTPSQIVEVLKKIYLEAVKIDPQTALRAKVERARFIKDNDLSHFVDWLIEKEKEEGEK